MANYKNPQFNNDAVTSVKEIFNEYIVKVVNQNTDEKIGDIPSDVQDIKEMMDDLSSVPGEIDVLKSGIKKCAEKNDIEHKADDIKKSVLKSIKDSYDHTKNNIDGFKSSSAAQFEKINKGIAANSSKAESISQNIKKLVYNLDENTKAAEEAKTEITDAVISCGDNIKSNISADISGKIKSLESNIANKVNSVDNALKAQTSEIIEAEAKSKEVLDSISEAINSQQSEIINSLSTAVQSNQTEVIGSISSSIDSKHIEVIGKISESKELSDAIGNSCSQIYAYIQEREKANQLIINKQQKMMYFIIGINALMFLGILISITCLLF